MISGSQIAPQKQSVTDQTDLAYITPGLTNELYGVLSLEQRSSETSLRSNTFQKHIVFRSLSRRNPSLEVRPFLLIQIRPLLSGEESTTYYPTFSDAIRKLQQES